MTTTANTDTDTRLAFRVPREIAQEVERRAEQDERSISGEIRHLIRRALADQKGES